MKGYVAIPIRLPTGEVTGYIEVTDAKLPKEFHLSNVVTFSKEDGLGRAPRKCGAFLLSANARYALGRVLHRCVTSGQRGRRACVPPCWNYIR
jgi:hypothetical protein